MTIVRKTHHRVLNSLEAQAVDMTVNGFFPHENMPLEFTLGEEGGKPFVDVERGSKAIRIHFEDKVE
jgi:hypothetical protein